VTAGNSTAWTISLARSMHHITGVSVARAASAWPFIHWRIDPGTVEVCSYWSMFSAM